MPGRSGLELQRDLAAANRQVPIIFITAHADIPMTVQAMKGGAIEFLTKPFRDQDLLEAVQTGLARDRARRESDSALDALRERFGTRTLLICASTPPCLWSQDVEALSRSLSKH
jgi:FixJ family two-component response regulator